MLAVIKPILRPLLCLVSLVLIQYFVHSESYTDLISYISWGATLVIIQSICTRPGFLYRFAFAMFLIGALLLPDMYLRGGSERAGLETASAISNPNNLSAWFGFCAVYFLIRALQSSRFLDQLLSGVITFISLFVVGLTVSRGALISLALTAIVIFRKQLKRGFVPIFVFTLLLGVGVVFGVFDSAIAHYTARGTEETGRGTVLIPALLRFEDNLAVGVGLSNIGTPTPEGEVRFPHDSLVFLGLSSGIVPLLFFIAYWLSSLRTAIHTTSAHPYASYLMPLLVYCSFFIFVHDSIFMYPWFIAAFSACYLEGRRKNRLHTLWHRTMSPSEMQALAHRRA
jgi:hypothetical protein